MKHFTLKFKLPTQTQIILNIKYHTYHNNNNNIIKLKLYLLGISFRLNISLKPYDDKNIHNHFVKYI